MKFRGVTLIKRRARGYPSKVRLRCFSETKVNLDQLRQSFAQKLIQTAGLAALTQFDYSFGPRRPSAQDIETGRIVARTTMMSSGIFISLEYYFDQCILPAFPAPRNGRRAFTNIVRLTGDSTAPRFQRDKSEERDQ